MSDHEPTLLESLERCPVQRAPLADLISGGRALRRRRRRTLVAGLVGASLLVLGGGAVAAPAISGHSESGDARVADGTDQTDRADEADRVDPAVGDVEGMRFVGIGGASIAVPSGWRSNHVSCGTPLSNTYYSPGSRDCKSGTSPRVSSVAMSTEHAEYLPGPDALSPAGEIRGHEIRVSATVCFQSDPGVCTQTFAVPDLDAYFHLTVQSPDGGEELVRTVRESLRVLEPDQRVVPYLAGYELAGYETETEVVSALEAAGLAVQVERTTCPPTARCGPGVTGLEPPAGSVVPAGSDILVTVLEATTGRALQR